MDFVNKKRLVLEANYHKAKKKLKKNPKDDKNLKQAEKALLDYVKKGDELEAKLTIQESIFDGPWVDVTEPMLQQFGDQHRQALCLGKVIRYGVEAKYRINPTELADYEKKMR